MLYKKSILDVFDVISVSFSVNSRFQIIIASKHFEVAQEIDLLFLTRELIGINITWEIENFNMRY